jgi:hypothetical protein
MMLPQLSKLGLLDSSSYFPVQGIDINRFKNRMTATETAELDQAQDAAKPKLVLMAVRELGIESYYQRRGFRTVWTGTVPVGMWDCKMIVLWYTWRWTWISIHLYVFLDMWIQVWVEIGKNR